MKLISKSRLDRLPSVRPLEDLGLGLRVFSHGNMRVNGICNETHTLAFPGEGDLIGYTFHLHRVALYLQFLEALLEGRVIKNEDGSYEFD